MSRWRSEDRGVFADGILVAVASTPEAAVALVGELNLDLGARPLDTGSAVPWTPYGPGEPLPCWCRRCERQRPERMGLFVVCPACGNKRCPRATDHRLACTGSNEPGQWGSVYGTLLPGQLDP